MTEKSNGFRNVYLALYFIGVVLSGAGGNYLWMRNAGPEIIAPDRFTGAQAAELRKEIAACNAKVLAVQRRVDRLPPRALEFEVKLLRKDLTALKQSVEGHELSQHGP